MKRYKYLASKFSLSVSFGDIFRTLNRRRELRRLVKWAARKQLPGPLAAYRSKFELEELRLKYCAGC